MSIRAVHAFPEDLVRMMEVQGMPAEIAQMATRLDLDTTRTPARLHLEFEFLVMDELLEISE